MVVNWDQEFPPSKVINIPNSVPKNNKFGLSCNLIQIYNIPSPDNFIDKQVIENIDKKKLSSVNSLVSSSVKSSGFVPSVNDLTNALLKIKK